ASGSSSTWTTRWAAGGRLRGRPPPGGAAPPGTARGRAGAGSARDAVASGASRLAAGLPAPAGRLPRVGGARRRPVAPARAAGPRELRLGRDRVVPGRRAARRGGGGPARGTRGRREAPPLQRPRLAFR